MEVFGRCLVMRREREGKDEAQHQHCGAGLSHSNDGANRNLVFIGVLLNS